MIVLLTFLCFLSWQVYAYSEECSHITDITKDASHTIICSKLYHGIWAIPMANPVASGSLSPALPCNTACYTFNFCPLAKTCIKGDDICIFSNAAIRSGQSGSGCAGNGFQMYYLCLPLKAQIQDVCYGLPGSVCYEDDFRSGADQRWTKVIQNGASNLGSLTQSPNNPADKDRLRFTAINMAAAHPAKPGMLLFISSPIAVNWENYVVTANWRLDPVPANDFEQFQATTTQMVGITFRHNGNAKSGSHYMVGWLGTRGASSTLGLYEWTGSSYKVLKTAKTAKLPANLWFLMIVRVVRESITVLTNRAPLQDYRSDCSQARDENDNLLAIDPVNCSGNQIAMTYELGSNFNAFGSVGMYFAGANGFADDLTVRKLAREGFCGNNKCEAEKGEDCVNCPNDCPAPCGCGDGVCAGDSEALGCRTDCFFECVVKYYNPVEQKWKRRFDNVAAYFSFDDPSNMGKDDSGNGLDLAIPFQEHRTTGCAPGAGRQKFKVQTNGCAVTTKASVFFLQDIRRAYARLPVHGCDVTIALFAKMTGFADTQEQSSIIRWGSNKENRYGLSLNIRADWGTSGSDGYVTFFFGQHVHVQTGVDWNKPGLRHLVFTYSKDKIETQIFVDGVFKSKKPPCTDTGAPQMVTFGRMEIGRFTGILDDLKIISTVWTPTQVGIDFTGGQVVEEPTDLGDQLKPIVYPTPLPVGFTPPPVPAPTTTTTTGQREETLGPLWAGPTPPVRTCRQICEDECKKLGKRFTRCQCYGLYSNPAVNGGFSCPAAQVVLHATVVVVMITVSFVLAFM